MDTLTSGTSRIGMPIAVDGTHNLRNTAGYPAADGAVTSAGLLRSDALHRLTALGIEQFAALGVTRVVDLRDANEVRQAPSAFSADGIETLHHPIFEGASVPAAGTAPSLRQVYRAIVTDRVRALTGAVRLIADAPAGAVLVHCTAGKDRTGVVVATALLAVGVSREDVVADYAASAENLAGEWVEGMIAAACRRSGGRIDDTVRELIATSPAEALEDALDVIDRLHGGVEQMLLSTGLDQDALGRLRSRLLI